MENTENAKKVLDKMEDDLDFCTMTDDSKLVPKKKEKVSITADIKFKRFEK